MTYEVRKGRRLSMATKPGGNRYPQVAEASIQAAGYDIYIDGKRQKKARHAKAGRGGLTT